MDSCLDHTQDATGTERHRLTQLYDAPGFVKTASHDQLCGSAATPSHVFADINRRVYPCHTKAATWMSALFFADKQSQIKTAEAAQIRKRIEQAAASFDIGTAVTALWEKMAHDAHDDEGRLPDDAFAIVWSGENGTKERHYPLRNGNEVIKAASWFTQYRQQFTFKDRHVVATRIMEKAAELGAAIEDADIIERCAGFGHCPQATAIDAWTKRASFVAAAKPELSEAADTVVGMLQDGTLSMRDRTVAIKVASLMDEFDSDSGVAAMYGSGLFDNPEDTLFALTEKAASDFVNEHVQTTTGNVYKKAALAGLTIDHVRSWLGDDFADEVGGYRVDVEKMASVVPTLPRPEAVMFDQMVEKAGVPVFARQKVASDAGITTAELTALAAEYVGAK